MYVYYTSCKVCRFVIVCIVGTPISGPLLKSKARQLYPLVYPNDPGPDGGFKAADGWLNRFGARHGVRVLSIQGESLSAATDMLLVFRNCL